jgi:hypothetical protein
MITGINHITLAVADVERSFRIATAKAQPWEGLTFFV